MKQKLSVERILNAYAVASKADFSKIEYEGQVKVLNAMKAMRPVSDNYRAFVKELDEKKNRKEIAGEALVKVINDEAERIVEIDIAPFTEDEMKGVWKNNTLTGAEMLALDDVLGSKKK